MDSWKMVFYVVAENRGGVAEQKDRQETSEKNERAGERAKRLSEWVFCQI